MSRRLVTLDPFALQFKKLLKQCADGVQFLVESVEHLLDVAGFRQSYHDSLLRFPCPQYPGQRGRASSVGGYFIFDFAYSVEMRSTAPGLSAYGENTPSAGLTAVLDRRVGITPQPTPVLFTAGPPAGASLVATGVIPRAAFTSADCAIATGLAPTAPMAQNILRHFASTWT